MLYHVTSQWRVSNLIIPIPIAQASRPIQALQTGQFSNTREDFEFPDRSISPPFNTDPDFHSIHHGPPHRFLELLRFASSPTRAKSLFEASPPANFTLTGLAVRFWQVGIEMRPFFNRSSLWAYPVYALGGASFGNWLQGVDDRQAAQLGERKRALLEKRARKAQRDAERGQEA